MLPAPLLNEVRSVSKRGTLIGVLSCSFALLAPVPCDAAPEPYPLELTWDAPQSCPQLDEVEEQIRALVSGLTNGQWQSSLHATGTIAAYGQRFELTLIIQQGQTSGRRVIVSDDCESLGKAAAVVLGLLIRKERLGRELSEQEIRGETEQPAQRGAPDVATASPLASARPAIPPSAPPKTPTPVTSTGRGWSALVIAPNVLAETGTLPHPSYGVGLGAGVLHGGWRAFATGSLWLAQATRPFQEHPFEARFRRHSADLTGCYAWPFHPVFEAGPCAQVSLDWVSAEATGGRLVSRSDTSFLFSAGAGLAGFLRFGASTALMVTAIGRVATRRPTFVIEAPPPFPTDQVHRVPALNAAMSLGFVWNF